MNTLKHSFRRIALIPVLLLCIHAAQSQTLSDDVIKRNVTTIDSPLKSLLKLEPRIFEYDTENFKSLRLKEGRQYGFLADNMSQVLPGIVSSKTVSYMYGKNTYRNQTIYTVNETSLIPVLVASIQELHHEIEQLKKEIEQLRK